MLLLLLGSQFKAVARPCNSHLLRLEELLIDAAILCNHVWWAQNPTQVLDPLYSLLCFCGRYLDNALTWSQGE